MLNVIIIREMEIKTTMRYHFTAIVMTIIIILKLGNTNIGKDVNKLELLVTAGRNKMMQPL